MPLDIIRKFASWVAKQVDGFIGGLMRLVSTPPEKVLPPGLWERFMWILASFTWAFGTSTPTKMIFSSLVLAVLAFFASWLSFGLTVPFLVFFTITLAIGFARLVPVVDDVFTSARDSLVP
jgi:hypothetical protein